MNTSLGDKIVGRLKTFTDALRTRNTNKFTCRKISLNLQPTTYSPQLVKKTRKILRASQAVFAQFLGVSVKAVRAWEQGVYPPPDMACRFMDEIRRSPPYWQKRMLESIEDKATA